MRALLRPPTPGRCPASRPSSAEIAELITPLIDTTPPDPAAAAPARARPARRARRRARLATARRISDALYLFATSATQYLGEYFEIRAGARRRSAGTRSTTRPAGPSTPGTAYVLLHDHASEQAGGGIRQWGFVRGGIGRVTEAMADAAREAGADDPHRGAGRADPGRGRPRRRGRARRRRARSRAARVLSNADPKTHLPRPGRTRALLPDRFARRRRRLPLRGHEREDQPRRRPAAGRGGGRRRRGCSPITAGSWRSNPTVAEMDAGQAEARAGRPAPDPHIELCIPTVHDPSLAPGGQSRGDDRRQLPALHARRAAPGTRSATRSPTARSRSSRRYFPGLDRLDRRPARCWPDRPRVAARDLGRPRPARRHVVRPALQPAPGPRLGRLPDPDRDLWLCGAGTHPGGGVTGANGRNCAREVIRDQRGLPAGAGGGRGDEPADPARSGRNRGAGDRGRATRTRAAARSSAGSSAPPIRA